jgi:uncharacterized protein YpmB
LLLLIIVIVTIIIIIIHSAYLLRVRSNVLACVRERERQAERETQQAKSSC